MVFDKIVDISTISLNDFALQYSSNSSAISLQLTGGTAAYASMQDLTNVIITMDAQDRSSIQLSSVGKSQSNTFLTAMANSIYDPAGNGLNEIDTAHALALITLVADQTSPKIIGFGLDMTFGMLYINFSTVISSDTVNPSILTLQMSKNQVLGGPTDLSYYRLTSGNDDS